MPEIDHDFRTIRTQVLSEELGEITEVRDTEFTCLLTRSDNSTHSEDFSKEEVQEWSQEDIVVGAKVTYTEYYKWKLGGDKLRQSLLLIIPNEMK